MLLWWIVLCGWRSCCLVFCFWVHFFGSILFLQVLVFLLILCWFCIFVLGDVVVLFWSIIRLCCLFLVLFYFLWIVLMVWSYFWCVLCFWLYKLGGVGYCCLNVIIVLWLVIDFLFWICLIFFFLNTCLNLLFLFCCVWLCFLCFLSLFLCLD